MKRWFFVFIVAVVLMLSTVSFAVANGDPVGGCPDDFHLHTLVDHDHDHGGPHKHVGNDRDFNGDGWNCGKHVGPDGSIHVHTDNNVPLP